MHSTSIINENASEVVDDVIKLHVRRSSRTKHHKSKTKHHKDKRKKRRHSKNGIEDSSTALELSECTNENTLDVQNGGLVEIRDLSNCETTIVSELDAKLKLSVESFGINTKNVESATTKTEHVDSVRFINDVHNTANKDTRCDAKFVGASDESANNALEDNRITKLQFNDATALPFPKCISNTEDLNKDVEYLLDPVPSVNDSVETQIPNAPEKENKIDAMHHVKSQEHKDATLCNASKDSESKNIEDRKLKRKRKRPRHDTQVEENSTRNSSENNTVNEAAIFKHRRKKHRHTNEHKTKKHHDVRKAPQDGIVVQEEGQKICPQEVELSSTKNGGTGRTTEDTDGIISEPQRLAIKIKLCQECNSRHLQDACPLMTPQYTIEDTITYEDWLNKHKENTEVIKAIKSEDPMSEGYGRLTDDSFESDEESLTSNEQCKTKSKVQREEKQLVIDTDRPLYARESLPDCLELRITNTDHGLGIYAKNMVPMYSKLGPLIGTSVREMDIPDDFSMRHIWEVLSLFRFIVILLHLCMI